MSLGGPPNDPQPAMPRRSLVKCPATGHCGGVPIRAAAHLLAIACGLLVAACGADQSPTPGALPSTALPDGKQIRPGVVAAVTEPIGEPAGDIVVLVPGGGWVSADPSGLAPLAEDLAARGATVVTLTYRTARDGVYFPEPVDDVECGIAFAAATAEGAVAAQEPQSDPMITVVGHSAGAQLSAVAALNPTTSGDPDCPYPPARADALIGLAGPYDVVAAERQAVNLFGPQYPRLDQWDAGNPIVLAPERPELPVLLVHGQDDPLVPASVSVAFSQALVEGGHPVDLQVLDGVDHDSVYGADVAGPVIVSWLGLDAMAREADPETR